jgi:hypothetical protein
MGKKNVRDCFIQQFLLFSNLNTGTTVCSFMAAIGQMTALLWIYPQWSKAKEDGYFTTNFLN